LFYKQEIKIRISKSIKNKPKNQSQYNKKNYKNIFSF